MQLDRAGEAETPFQQVGKSKLLPSPEKSFLERSGNLRDGHEELFVGIAGKERLRVQTLSPRFLDNLGSGIGFTLVESGDFFKLDLLPQEALQGWLDIFAVVMTLVVVPMIIMRVAMIVRVVRHP